MMKFKCESRIAYLHNLQNANFINISRQTAEKKKICKQFEIVSDSGHKYDPV